MQLIGKLQLEILCKTSRWGIAVIFIFEKDGLVGPSVACVGQSCRSAMHVLFWVCLFFLTLKSRVLIFMNMSRTVSSMAHESECCPMNPWLSPNLCGFKAVEVPCILFFVNRIVKCG